MLSPRRQMCVIPRNAGWSVRRCVVARAIGTPRAASFSQSISRRRPASGAKRPSSASQWRSSSLPPETRAAVAPIKSIVLPALAKPKLVTPVLSRILASCGPRCRVRPGMPFFESGLSASSEYDYHSRQFWVHPGNPGSGRSRLAPILVGSVRQPISKGWAQKTDNDLASRRDCRRDRDRKGAQSMKPAAFEYERPGTVAQALDALATYGERAKVLAGGQSLIPMLNLRVVRTERVIDIGRLDELRYVKREGDEIRIGALATHNAVMTAEPVRSSCPIIAEAYRQVSHHSVRNRGTIGGSLCQNQPGADVALVVNL